MITKADVDKVFDDYVAAFDELAAKEDELETMRLDLDSYKEGSSKFVQAQEDLKKFELGLAAYQRKMRRAALEIDRIKQKLLVEEIAAHKQPSHSFAGLIKPQAS